MERPIGTYTGIPSISLPLTSIKQGNFNIPVTLSYNGGGIKVEEMASWAGLGWNLSVGGSVTREMRGLPDDFSINGYYHNNVDINYFLNSGDEQFNIAKNNLDIEPDVYYYNVNGRSGEFFFDRNHQIVQQNPSGMSIQPVLSNNLFSGWIIKDESGNVYYFGTNQDNSYSATDINTGIAQENDPRIGSNSNVIDNFITTWHLVQMADMNNLNKIDLRYIAATASVETVTPTSLYVYHFENSLQTCVLDPFQQPAGLITSQNEKYLSQVITANQITTFNTSTDRIDYPGGRRLNSIVTTDKNNNPINSFSFGYDYFQSPPLNPSQPNYPADLNTARRLKLLSLSAWNNSSTQSQNYSFSYYEDAQMPNRITGNVDYWGYGNGGYGFGLPNIQYVLAQGAKLVIDQYNNRQPNSNAILGTLKRITFPTGGTREYIYEQNQTLYDPADNVQIIQNLDAYNVNGGGQISIEPNQFNYNTPDGTLFSQNFTVNNGEPTTDLKCSLQGDNTCQANTYTIYNLDNGASYPLVIVPQIQGVTVPNGNYKIVVHSNNPGTSCPADFNMTWIESHIDKTQIVREGYPYYRYNVDAGGIRIKEIKDYDPVTNSTNSTKYKYNLFGDPTLTSGLLVKTPTFAIIDNTGGGCLNLKLSSKSFYPLVAQDGSYVVYTNVTTYQDNNGYIQQSFSFDRDPDPLITDPYLFPVPPSDSHKYFRGDLISTKFFDNNSNLLKENYQNWSTVAKASSGLTYRLYAYWSYNSGGQYAPYYIRVSPYYLYSYQKYNYYNDEIIYNNGVATDIRTDNTFFDNTNTHLLLSKATTLNNKTNTDYYRYALNADADFKLGLTSSESAMRSTLLTNNYLAPLEITTYSQRGSATPLFVGGNKTVFGQFNGSQLYPSATKQYSDLSNFREQDLLNYDNTTGTLLSESVSQGPKTTYLYSYNGQYPIAQIINGDYSKIASVLGSSAINTFRDLSNPTKAQIDAFVAPMKSALPNAQVTTYTYTPLAGMTSMTDAKGMPTYYEYDSFQRLMNIKDKDGNIVKHIDYHYQNQ